MKSIGIVGHEGAKFTPAKEAEARALIRYIIQDSGADVVISGKCPLGGIDIWAVEEASKMSVMILEYPPEVDAWDPPGAIGFKARNMQIADASDVVHCIVVKEYPETYTGRRFTYCYHCKSDDHIKSGGCWTALRCKEARWHKL